ncbi:bifunctional phosphoribosylaminoimidazolecarboxamide formyltransferase/IMP cyclohydrolase [Rubrobacter tropicus]|uniref:Bifunctional purine biosynthesis protein PurH n=1 Tax=Rubrobacter tropicus TaxID=2653851 RepID=A0A6G8Q7N4_9ACTN|nr:bifunctional phosphoribosylaminoimidazolecarboxamide formyltransferase/IMP cyclohydrolase [Rubrobacter tropicus]QIN82486.1 bifunctional phosphoribosylaminoimidazolecarboxamide formyltransferase/IMP cyclohydrolase [Rubrobacter tropicus]
MKRRALVSVSDKRGVAAFARKLSSLGFEIISTGGTAKALEESRIPVVQVSEITGAPEMLDGRVKTLHPKIHGGILADLENPDHVTQLVEHDIGPIDLVCINLYPFEETVAADPSEKEAIEQIDVGGPAMLRAAAKNFKSVTVVPSSSFYNEVISELENEGQVSEETRRRLALAAFRRTAQYDAAISGWLAVQAGDHDEFPERRFVRYEKVSSLRYGENPHQKAAYYAEEGEEHLLSGVEKLQGKEISFNNLYDLDAARTLLSDLTELEAPAAAVIVKHANPCGAAVGDSLVEAYRKALASDPLSAFGGIVALSGEVDGGLAAEISKVFTEILAAPGFTPEAREVFSAKPSVRVLKAGSLARPALSSKSVTGGVLLQEADALEGGSEYRVVTEKRPSTEQMDDLLFAWRVARTVKSNAIVLVKDGATVGIGAGQMSRVDSSEIAAKKAGDGAVGSVAASDAFFPFADGVEALARDGVAAVIQPGGSVRDEEVVAAANRLGLAMVFTGRRHFNH